MDDFTFKQKIYFSILRRHNFFGTELHKTGLYNFEIQTINNQYTIYNPYQTSINVKKNQTVILSYTVKDYSTNITSTLQQNITIDNSSQIDYILNY